MAKALFSPADYRRRAEHCMRLINTVRAPTVKKLLRERAALWVKTAIEMERAEALLADMPEPKPKN
jgi:hypothetical protein